MKESLRMLDEIIEYAEHDNFEQCKKEGTKFETFYVFNLKILKQLIEEEIGNEKEPRLL